MELSALVIFTLALVISAGSPGPSVAALVARVLVRSWRDVAPFVSAMWIGEAIWLTCAVAGLAVIADSFYLALVIVKYCGVVYLGYLAWRMWIAPVEADANGCSLKPAENNPWRMFLAGMAITLGNPKIMFFYMALLPTIIDLDNITLLGWAELTGIMLFVLMFIDIAYIVLAARARLFLVTPRAVKIANRVSAGVLGTAAAVIAAR